MDIDKSKSIEDTKSEEKEDEPSENYSENPFRIIPR